jgi:UDP-N-acetylenolpyruvoylglucosamine reductase
MTLPVLPVRADVPLAPLTTLELGGSARHLVEAADDDTVVEALRWAEARGLPALILGGGSNVVIADRGWDGLVVRVATRGRRFAESPDGTVTLTVAAGEPWDDVVADTVARDLAGLECLSGIPGLVGATPIQNVGAYGQEVADTILSVTVLERASKRVHQLAASACAFAYRDSAFKHDPDRFVVLSVTFALRRGGAPALRYRELAEALASNGGPPPTLGAVPCRRARAAPEEVDADRGRRSQPAQRRIVLHQPDRGRGRSGCRRRPRGRAGGDRPPRRDAALAGGRRGDKAVGWLADRARRHSQGAAPGCGGRFDRPRALAGPPGRWVDRRRCSSWRARWATRCMAGSL